MFLPELSYILQAPSADIECSHWAALSSPGVCTENSSHFGTPDSQLWLLSAGFHELLPVSPSQCCGLETLSGQSGEATTGLTCISTPIAPGPALPDGQGLTTLVSYFLFLFSQLF